MARSPRAEKAPRPPADAPRQPRRRRDAAEARTAILDAAEKRLVLAGPAGIRLQEVAADVGVSHPTVLHHFGSREALVSAVIRRSFAALHSDLVSAIQGSTGGEEQLAAMLEAVFRTLSAGGHGRVLLWLALEGHRLVPLARSPAVVSTVERAAPAARERGGFGAEPQGTKDSAARAKRAASAATEVRQDFWRAALGGAEVRLSDVVDAAHAYRTKKRGEARAPQREDTAHVVVLAALALTGFTALGPTLLEEAGLPHDDAAGTRFRAWLARVLLGHLQSGG